MPSRSPTGQPRMPCRCHVEQARWQSDSAWTRRAESSMTAGVTTPVSVVDPAQLSRREHLYPGSLFLRIVECGSASELMDPTVQLKLAPPIGSRLRVVGIGRPWPRLRQHTPKAGGCGSRELAQLPRPAQPATFPAARAPAKLVSSRN
eukprot:354166-Rhodomonas_salina.5